MKREMFLLVRLPLWMAAAVIVPLLTGCEGTSSSLEDFRKHNEQVNREAAQRYKRQHEWPYQG